METIDKNQIKHFVARHFRKIIIASLSMEVGISVGEQIRIERKLWVHGGSDSGFDIDKRLSRLNTNLKIRLGQ